MPIAQGAARHNLGLGDRVFHKQCAACHGDDATGSASDVVPSLRSQHYSYLLDQLRRLRENDKHQANEALVLFLRGFDEREMAAVANYLAHLPGASKSIDH
jgi:cytochrome c553